MKLLYEINYRQSELRHEQHNPAAEICVISRHIETGPNCQILKPQATLKSTLADEEINLHPQGFYVL